MLKRPLLVSLLLGVATFIVIGTAKTYLPYSAVKDSIIDTLTVSGAVIVGIIYPQGIHTGSGSPSWALWVMVANCLVYILFWYICIRFIQYLRRRSMRPA